MKIFVAGATGVIGRRAVQLLVADGHDVTGASRSDEKDELLRSLGATPVRVDLFDAAAVKDAVAGHEIVVNVATHIPRVSRAAMPGAWTENDRIRADASANLVDAALVTGARRYVQESITFGYADAGADWVDEASLYDEQAYASVLVAEANAARFTQASDGGVGVVLRFGMFYDAESHTTEDFMRAATHGRMALPGRADGYVSWIATEDAAAAVVAALDAPPGTYNVVDDEPVTRAEIAAVLASVLRHPVKLLPAVASTAARARRLTQPLTRSLRVANGAFKSATAWSPSRPSIRLGFPPVVHQVVAGSALRGSLLARILLATLVPATAISGVWATVSPRAFYDRFPGGGIAWVRGDGPFNEHLVRDFGSLNMALAIVLVVAVWKGGRVWLTTASVAYLAFGVPHLVYHLRHTDVLEGFARSSSLGGLSMAVAAALLALIVSRRASTDAI